MTVRRDERGVVAMITAVVAPVLLIAAALVVDLGLARVDMQVNRSAADAATLAGLRALNAGDGKPHPFVGVCTAIEYLHTNASRFGAMNDANGTWTTGEGFPAPNGCTDLAARGRTCTPGSPSTWARFDWTGPVDGEPLNVRVQSGYALSTGSGWQEDSLQSAAAENDDGAQGCNQLAVFVTQARAPGLGSLATSSLLRTSIRSVGRVREAPAGYAAAMLLLKRTGCPVLQVGSVGGGADSYVRVYGAMTSTGRSQPGTIHSDSDGSGCTGSGGNWLYYGKADSHIVAYAAPLTSNPILPDPARPGSITSVAGVSGVDLSLIRDAAGNVYGSAGLNEAGAVTAAKLAPLGRDLITRRPVDERYAAGVGAAVAGAQTSVFGSLTPANAVANGYTKVTCANGRIASLPVLTSTSKLYVDCPVTKSIPTVQAGVVVFNGTLDPNNGNPVQLPNAHHVYVVGGSDAITLGTGGEFRMHTAGMTDLLGGCVSDQRPGKAVLMVENGGVKQTGGMLQLCGTTVVLMGGRADGCLPTTTGSAPTQTPCAGTSGTGQLKQTGGNVDWTAPDAYDVMTRPDGTSDPLRAASWADGNGPEDLALWTESSSDSSGNKASMGGGALFHVKGVFMTPNYDPFTLAGNGLEALRNAQYIASSIALSGGVQLSMTVDPDSAVPLPKLQLIGLIR